MSLCKRIIPCLDIAGGRVVKGVNFKELRDIGDPVELALKYERQGADELTILDINASHENRGNFVDLVREIARNVFIPLTVGGGIRGLDDMRALLQAGADKVGVNTAAVKNPNMISEAAREFGSQFFVLSVDTKFDGGQWRITTVGSRNAENLLLTDWVRRAVDFGAGEILLNVIDADGTRAGYAIEVTKQVSRLVPVPVIASGGAGTFEHVREVLDEGCADAALVASLLHTEGRTVAEIKNYLSDKGVLVRPISQTEPI